MVQEVLVLQVCLLLHGRLLDQLDLRGRGVQAVLVDHVHPVGQVDQAGQLVLLSQCHQGDLFLLEAQLDQEDLLNLELN